MAAGQKTNTPLLNLEIDTASRDVIRIDGKDYELRRSDDFSINASNTIGLRLKAIGEIVAVRQKSGRLNRQLEARLRALLAEVVGHILAAPPNIRRKLTPVMQFRIVNVFQMRSLISLTAASAAVMKSGQAKGLDEAIERESAGLTSSRGSSVSTEAIRSTGGRGTRRA